MSFTNKYTYTAELRRDGNVTPVSGETTVGGFEGEAEAQSKIRGEASKDGYNATNVRTSRKS